MQFETHTHKQTIMNSNHFAVDEFNIADVHACANLCRMAHIFVDNGCTITRFMLNFNKLQNGREHKWCPTCINFMWRAIEIDMDILEEVFADADVNPFPITRDQLVGLLRRFDYLRFFVYPKSIPMDMEIAELLIGHGYICAEMAAFIPLETLMIKSFGDNLNFANIDRIREPLCDVAEYGDKIIEAMIHEIMTGNPDSPGAQMTNYQIAHKFTHVCNAIQKFRVSTIMKYYRTLMDLFPLSIFSAMVSRMDIAPDERWRLTEDYFPFVYIERMLAFSDEDVYTLKLATVLQWYISHAIQTYNRADTEYNLALAKLILDKYPMYVMSLVYSSLQSFEYEIDPAAWQYVIAPDGYTPQDIYFKACAGNDNYMRLKTMQTRVLKHYLQQVWTNMLRWNKYAAAEMITLDYFLSIKYACAESDVTEEMFTTFDDEYSTGVDSAARIDLLAIKEPQKRRRVFEQLFDLIQNKSAKYITLVYHTSAPYFMHIMHEIMFGRICEFRRDSFKFLNVDMMDLITSFIINPTGEISDKKKFLMAITSAEKRLGL
jgi:hypothetical protein